MQGQGSLHGDTSMADTAAQPRAGRVELSAREGRQAARLDALRRWAPHTEPGVPCDHATAPSQVRAALSEPGPSKAKDVEGSWSR